MEDRMPTNHESTSGRRVVFLALLVVMSVVSLARGQDSVELRSSARVDGKAAVLLRDVAELKGEAAKAVGDVVVLDKLPAGEGEGVAWPSVDIATVRRALEARGGVNWGRLMLRGSSCALRRPVAEVAKAPAPATTDKVEATKSTPGAPTVRDLIAPRLAQLFAVDASRVRVTFDDSAKELLDTPVTGRTCELTPQGTSEKVPMLVRVYDQDRVAASGTIRVLVRVQRWVILARVPMKKGDVLDLADITSEERWVSPTADLADTSMIGGVTRTKLSAGQLVQSSDVEAAVVVKKGELVSVSCVSASVVIKAIARATQDARAGDVIKFEHTDTRKRSFLARVSGPGRAVSIAAGSDSLAPTDAVTDDPARTEALKEGPLGQVIGAIK